MPIEYPLDCTTKEDKLEYCTRLSELLRQLHNVVGLWRRSGIPRSTYNKLPDKLKARISYKPKLSEAEWQAFRSFFFSRQKVVLLELGKYKDSEVVDLEDPRIALLAAKKAQYKESSRWNIDVNLSAL